MQLLDDFGGDNWVNQFGWVVNLMLAERLVHFIPLTRSSAGESQRNQTG